MVQVTRPSAIANLLACALTLISVQAASGKDDQWPKPTVPKEIPQEGPMPSGLNKIQPGERELPLYCTEHYQMNTKGVGNNSLGWIYVPAADSTTLFTMTVCLGLAQGVESAEVSYGRGKDWVIQPMNEGNCHTFTTSSDVQFKVTPTPNTSGGAYICYKFEHSNP
jgi:hypothetical protein